MEKRRKAREAIELENEIKNTEKKDKKEVSGSETIINEILGVLFVGMSIYTMFILFFSGKKEMTGIVGESIYKALKFVIGGFEWIFPIIVILYGLMLVVNRKVKINRIKFGSFVLFFVFVAALKVLLAVDFSNIKTTVETEILRVGGDGQSGGFIGSLISLGLYELFGRQGAIISLVTMIVMSILIFANRMIKAGIKALIVAIVLAIKGLGKKRANPVKREIKINPNIFVKKEKIKDEIKIKLKNEDLKIEKAEKMVAEASEMINNNELITDDNFDEFDLKMEKPIEKVEKKGIVKEPVKEVIQEKYQQNLEEFEEEEEVIEVKTVEKKTIVEERKPVVQEKVEEKREVPKNTTIISQQEYSKSETHAENIFENKTVNQASKDAIERNIREKIDRLEKVLKEYGIDAKVFNYQIGPVITRLELSVTMGTRVKRIVALADDIAMNLEAKSIRIEAPIPGKNAIGVELPNDIAEPVYFSDILESKTFKAGKSPVDIALGKNIIGDEVVIDLRKMPHLLIAGRTGSGKSVCINTLIASIIYKSSPDEVKFIMVDPKMVELMPYNGIPHLLVPVIIEPKMAAIALKWAVNEMENRYRLLAKVGVRNLEGYNKLPNVEKLSYIVVIIDELADLMMVAPATIEESIARIAQKARAIGIHLIVATQRPSVDVITGTIKANLPSRISFSVASQIDSRTILDTPGAEKLLGRGDMLFLESGSPNLVRIQGAYISDEEIHKFTDYIKSKGAPKYNEEILVEEDDSKDQLYDKAIEVIKAEGRASTSLIQRKLKVGYSRAARIMDQLQESGIVEIDENGEKGIINV